VLDASSALDAITFTKFCRSKCAVTTKWRAGSINFARVSASFRDIGGREHPTDEILSVPQYVRSGLFKATFRNHWEADEDFCLQRMITRLKTIIHKLLPIFCAGQGIAGQWNKQFDIQFA
jgi:hypothetical protein